MTPRRRRLIAGCLSLLVLPLWTSCDSPGALGIFGLFGSGVQVVIINDTGYTAVPDLRISDSRNLFEDIFAEADQVTNFGNNGTIAPHQSVTVFFQCDGDLELIAFGGADFREGNGLAIGDADSTTRLRRDSDFDCGAVITIRLEGSIFNFSADVDVTDYGTSNDREANADSSSRDDLADRLEDLFD